MWMLDTGTCSYILRAYSANVIARLDAVPRNEVEVSSLVAAELRYGAERVKSRKLIATVDAWLGLFTIAPWDDDAARAYAKARTAVEAKGKPIGNLDLLIASHALACNATLVTNNIRHFSQVPGLRFENWL